MQKNGMTTQHALCKKVTPPISEEEVLRMVRADARPIMPARQQAALVSNSMPDSHEPQPAAVTEPQAPDPAHQEQRPVYKLARPAPAIAHTLRADTKQRTDAVQHPQHQPEADKLTLHPKQLVLAATNGEVVTIVLACSDESLRGFCQHGSCALARDQLAWVEQRGTGMRKLLAMFNVDRQAMYGLWVGKGRYVYARA